MGTYDGVPRRTRPLDAHRLVDMSLRAGRRCLALSKAHAAGPCPIGASAAGVRRGISSTVTGWQQKRRNLVTIIIFNHALRDRRANDCRLRQLGSGLWRRLAGPPVSTPAGARLVLVFERLLAGSRTSCRDAGRLSTARHSAVNASGPSTPRWQFSADHHLSRTAEHRDALAPSQLIELQWGVKHLCIPIVALPSIADCRLVSSTG
jgi:hypothetical protein